MRDNYKEVSRRKQNGGGDLLLNKGEELVREKREGERPGGEGSLRKRNGITSKKHGAT